MHMKYIKFEGKSSCFVGLSIEPVLVFRKRKNKLENCQNGTNNLGWLSP